MTSFCSRCIQRPSTASDPGEWQHERISRQRRSIQFGTVRPVCFRVLLADFDFGIAAASSTIRWASPTLHQYAVVATVRVIRVRLFMICTRRRLHTPALLVAEAQSLEQR
jgi:hypothetical protein